MYNKKNICKKIMIYIVFATNLIHGFGLVDFAKTCAGLGTVLLAAGATAAGIDWLTKLTDAQLIDKVRHDLHSIKKNNEYYISLFKQHLRWDRYNQTVRHDVLQVLSEQFLYDIASTNDTRYGQPFPSSVVQDCSQLEQDISLLLQRIEEIQRRAVLTEQDRYNLSAMRVLTEQLVSVQEELGLLKDYITKHISYFNLAQCGWQVNKLYTADFEVYNLYKYDQYNLLSNLDSIIHTKYKYTNFIYILYVEDLEATINNLLFSRNNVAYNYTGMITWVNQCIDQLRCIRSIVDNRYQLQILERDRLHLAQRRVAF
ncbi:hypothetical protein EKK58_03825 [Candidatus Dependentiae bacterium]|nr:MAG: hypothetical protein EKK58_03825 [Candidatus Dependentiae bacterium]